jgi:hypothetical protein
VAAPARRQRRSGVGPGHYYGTTVPGKHGYWKHFPLPVPTRSLKQLRHDLFEGGYWLIEDGLSGASCEILRARADEQGEGERVANAVQRASAQFKPYRPPAEKAARKVGKGVIQGANTVGKGVEQGAREIGKSAQALGKALGF